ncbi:MAG TPA: SAM-dependent methyltransferase [Methanocorpusculum sp.]|nr:SAM-dependent methyltransferase [Methanocorpusculum sp.]
MNVRAVPRSSLETVMQEPWVDTARKPYVSGKTAYVPVKDGEPYDEVLEERMPYCGRGYQKMGDTVIFHGEMPTKEDIGEVTAFLHPACILHSAGQSGVMRIPEMTVLKGTPHDVTFRESGISYTLNPAKVMFSQGNRGEKQRLKKMIRPGERVADMFAGIGYFTLTAAKAGAQVHAMELNPDSFAYLQTNISANHLGGLITPELGDCRTHLSGIYDRILMGHFDAPDFLSYALSHAKEGTVLHIHALGDKETAIIDAVVSAGFRYELTKHKVKKYAAHQIHYVYDLVLA